MAANKHNGIKLSEEDARRVFELRRAMAPHALEIADILDRNLKVRRPSATPAVYFSGLLPLGKSEPHPLLLSELDNAVDACNEGGGTVVGAVGEDGKAHFGCEDPVTGTCHEIGVGQRLGVTQLARLAGSDVFLPERTQERHGSKRAWDFAD